jgi:hypothetical protein
MFLRKGRILPDRFDLVREWFSEERELVENLRAPALDSRIRIAGWHFMWPQEPCSCSGFGRTKDRVIAHALSGVAKRFNAAELDSVQVMYLLAFRFAKVKVQPRQIQQYTSLDAGDGMSLRPMRAI